MAAGTYAHARTGRDDVLLVSGNAARDMRAFGKPYVYKAVFARRSNSLHVEQGGWEWYAEAWVFALWVALEHGTHMLPTIRTARQRKLWPLFARDRRRVEWREALTAMFRLMLPELSGMHVHELAAMPYTLAHTWKIDGAHWNGLSQRSGLQATASRMARWLDETFRNIELEYEPNPRKGAHMEALG